MKCNIRNENEIKMRTGKNLKKRFHKPRFDLYPQLHRGTDAMRVGRGDAAFVCIFALGDTLECVSGV